MQVLKISLHQGLLFFQDKAEQLVNENFGEDNIIELALEALEPRRNNPVDHIVNMPEFKIDSNIEATTLLRKVCSFFGGLVKYNQRYPKLKIWLSTFLHIFEYHEAFLLVLFVIFKLLRYSDLMESHIVVF